MTMRRFLLALSLLTLLTRVSAADAAPAPANATVAAEAPEIPAPLKEALEKYNADRDHWAFTETTRTKNSKGKEQGETVVRFDPSKTWAEQFTPLKVEGKAPTEKQLKEYRRRGEKRGERFEREEKEGKVAGSESPRIHINGDTAVIDLEHAIRQQAAPAGSLLYEIPLRNDPKSSLPVEKFQLFIRVNAERHVLENVAMKLRDSIRMKLIAKIKSGDASIDFAPVDPKFTPAMTGMTGGMTASVFFVSVGGTLDLKRTEFQRVKPYSEKFGVKIGTLKALDF